MIEPKEGQMVIYDEEGNEKLVTILLEFEIAERGAKYVIFEDAEDSDNVLAMRYNDEGELSVIEDDEEFEEVSEVFEAFQNEELEEE